MVSHMGLGDVFLNHAIICILVNGKTDTNMDMECKSILVLRFMKESSEMTREMGMAPWSLQMEVKEKAGSKMIY